MLRRPPCGCAHSGLTEFYPDGDGRRRIYTTGICDILATYQLPAKGRGTVNRKMTILLVSVLMAALSSMPAAPKTIEQYSALIAAVGGMTPAGSAMIDIWIDQFTPDEEVRASAALLKEKGMEALRRSLEKKEVGRISIGSGPAIPIALARSLPDGNNRVIRLFLTRNVRFIETVSPVRTRDYPFSLIEIRVDEKGNGEGVGIATAKIGFDAKTNQIVMESLGQGTGVVKLLNVRKP
jgi:hypothetical protein